MNQQEWTCICGKTGNRGKCCGNCGRPQEQSVTRPDTPAVGGLPGRTKRLPVGMLAVVVALLLIVTGVFAYNKWQESSFENHCQSIVQSLSEIKQSAMGLERLDGRVEAADREEYLNQLAQAEESLDMMKDNLSQVEPGRKYGDCKAALLEVIGLEREMLENVSNLVRNPTDEEVKNRVRSDVDALKTREARLAIRDVNFQEVLDWSAVPKAMDGFVDKYNSLKQREQQAAIARQKAELQSQCLKLLRGSWAVARTDYGIEFDDHGLLILPEPGPVGTKYVRRIGYKSFENMQVKADSGYASFDIVYSNGQRTHIEINNWTKLRWSADSSRIFDKMRPDTISDHMPASYQLIDE